MVSCVAGEDKAAGRAAPISRRGGGLCGVALVSASNPGVSGGRKRRPRMKGGKWNMTPMETTDADTARVETALLEGQWAGRIVASGFVALATGLSWVFAASAMIG